MSASSAPEPAESVFVTSSPRGVGGASNSSLLVRAHIGSTAVLDCRVRKDAQYGMVRLSGILNGLDPFLLQSFIRREISCLLGKLLGTFSLLPFSNSLGRIVANPQ